MRLHIDARSLDNVPQADFARSLTHFAATATHAAPTPTVADSLTHLVAGNCVPCELAREQGVGQFSPAPSPDEGDDLPAPASVNRVAWSGVIGVEGELTGDGRLIEPNALRWENLPIPLRYVATDVGGHDGAVVVGTIDSITRANGGAIEANGSLDIASMAGAEAARQVREGLTTGVSMDLDDVSFEIRVAAELLEDDGLGMPMLMLAREDDEDDDEPIAEPTPDEGEQPELDTDADGRVTVAELNSDDEVRVTTSGRIRAATIVAIPAFATAQIHLDSDIPDETPVEVVEQIPMAAARTEDDTPEALVAAAIPLSPPTSWFSDPRLAAPTALTVGEDGRVFGHLAVWGTCHMSHTSQGQCITPPSSPSGYAYFRTGSVLTRDGVEVAVGHLTLDTRHAAPTLSPASTVRHYEDTGHAVADVAAGEDAHGIWVAGALRPGTTPAQVRALRASPLSGDWRRVGSALELVAALAVNVPGFPVPRPSGLVAGGVMRTLVASGMVPPRKVRRPNTPGALSMDDLRYLKRLADRERAEEARLALGDLPDADIAAAKVRAFALKRRVDRMRVVSTTPMSTNGAI